LTLLRVTVYDSFKTEKKLNGNALVFSLLFCCPL